MSVASRLAARRLTGRPSALGRRRQLAGIMYALPTLVFVVVFFILPLLLVGQMSASDWKLLGGDKGINFPTNYGALNNNPLFWPAIEFTIRYTVIVTVLLIGLGLGLALHRAGDEPLGRDAAHRVPHPAGGRPRGRVAAVLGLLLGQHRAREPAPPGRRADRQADPVLRDAHERLPRRRSS